MQEDDLYSGYDDGHPHKVRRCTAGWQRTGTGRLALGLFPAGVADAASVFGRLQVPAGSRNTFQVMEKSSSSSSHGRAGLPPGTASTRLLTAMRPGTSAADAVRPLFLLLLVLVLPELHVLTS